MARDGTGARRRSATIAIAAPPPLFAFVSGFSYTH